MAPLVSALNGLLTLSFAHRNGPKRRSAHVPELRPHGAIWGGQELPGDCRGAARSHKNAEPSPAGGRLRIFSSEGGEGVGVGVIPDDDPPDPKRPEADNSLEILCEFFGATPADLLYLSSTSEDDTGERGVRLSRPVKKGGIILRMPLSSCLRDDAAPGWFASTLMTTTDEEDPEDDEDGEGRSDDECDDPGSDWSTRLGASLLELRLRESGSGSGSGKRKSGVDEGRSMWLSMLPNSARLRASLPVHWSEETVRSASCTALELAADARYFARAESANDMAARIRGSSRAGVGASSDPPSLGSLADEEIDGMCHDALDVVQTRSCRVERREEEEEEEGGRGRPTLRVLAPVFDFINHGSSRCEGDGCANACFELEDEGGGGER